MDTSRPRKKMLLYTLIPVGLVALIIAYIQLFTFFNTGITPSPNNTSRFSQFIDISFNKDLKSVGFVKISPNSSILASYEINKSSVRLFINDIVEYETLSIELQQIESVDGYKLDSFQFDVVLTDDLTDGEQLERALEEQDETTELRSDPILEHIPHSTLSYKITPDMTRVRADGSSIVDVNVEVFLTAADMRGDRDAALSVYKKQVEEYFSLKSINTENYTITYTIVESSLY
ncbi:hypothetical protein GW930_03575 [Candidatus Saccharibacteria bacterium]|nr:hypothetical protein [Candidatus Saccharibacteria bacterium]